MLEIQGLSKSYGKNLAVDDVSFTVPDGQVGILLGPNGAGKSTIIKSIAGLLRYKGTIRIQDIPARQLEAKRVFAYVPEIPNMFEALTVREHIEYVRMAYSSDITDEEEERVKKENISRATVDIADKVVDKQMRIVQEIASLLGETAAETKIALTKLKESIAHEDE